MIALIVVFLIGVAAAIVFSIRSIRRAVVPPVARAARTVWAAVKTPERLAAAHRRQRRRAVPLRGVAARVPRRVRRERQLLDAARAQHRHLDSSPRSSRSRAVAPRCRRSASPGMLTAFGVPESATAAAVLAHQLAVSYVPAIPGWFATRELLHRGLL